MSPARAPGAGRESSPHPFARHPHRTTWALTLPVMASLVVEPLAGVADTAFVERLGAAQAAALGAATALLSSLLWIFNFLGVGTQTEVAHAHGEGGGERVDHAASLGLGVALVLGSLAAALAWPLLEAPVAWMSGEGAVRAATRSYLEIRLLGAPAVIGLLAAFGALRGLQEMRAPLWIAAVMSAFNVAADPLLIFGAGPVPALGIAGAAWATVASQLLGLLLAVRALSRRCRLTARTDWARARGLVVVGRDMLLRTGALLAFLLVATRTALQIGVEAGAAHQALRQVWILLAFVLDAFAATAQSLIGFFLGGRRTDLARRVARVTCAWGLGAGGAAALALLAAESAVAALLVPPSARAAFSGAWLACALAQPLNALSFVTDGIHWGTRDFAYLRNAMLLCTGLGVVALVWIDVGRGSSLAQVWWVTAGWTALRALFGVGRIWPGVGSAPLAAPAQRARSAG